MAQVHASKTTSWQMMMMLISALVLIVAAIHLIYKKLSSTKLQH
jgi:flagellar biogenesis protein FliO